MIEKLLKERKVELNNRIGRPKTGILFIQEMFTEPWRLVMA